MKDNNNTMRLDMSNNPELSEFCGRKKVGDGFKAEITGKFREISKNEALIDVKKIEYDEKEIEPEIDKPIAIEVKAPPMAMPTDEEDTAYPA